MRIYYEKKASRIYLKTFIKKSMKLLENNFENMKLVDKRIITVTIDVIIVTN